MKILLIHQYFKEPDEVGGLRFNEMARIWKEDDHDITVLAGNLDTHTSSKRKAFKGKYTTFRNQNGVKVWRCHVSDKYNSNFLGRLWAYFSFVFSGTYAGLFKAKGQYDIILVTSPPLFVGITAYILSIFKRIPFVFEVRDLWPESAIDTGVVKNKFIIKFAYWFERFVYKKAKLINVLTPAFKDILINKKNVASNKIIMIPNASDFTLSDKLLDNFDREFYRNTKEWNDKIIISYVGAHGVANGLYQVLETAKILKDTNVLFVFIGAGMKKKELMDQVLKENINNVRFYDPVTKEEVLKFIIASDIGMSVLLKNDTFKTVYSNKTFDYMSCKKPILMAIDGVSKKLVEDSKSGLFIQPEDPVDFLQKVMYYLENPDKIKVDGESGYNYAKKYFDRDILAKKYLEEIEKNLNL